MIVDEDYIQTDGLIAENEHLHKIVTEQDKEIERLKKREQECIDHYLVQCKYASEMEDKYITANNIINELEKFLIEYSQDLEFRCYANAFLDKLQELKNIGLN